MLAGMLTPALIGWIGWRSFGRCAGVAAACLSAFSGAHSEFSRMALTDATFLLAWLIAMLSGQRFLERPSAIRAILLGLSTGLAWNTKYNGWLPGVIVFVAAGLDALTLADCRRRRALVRVFGLGAFGALIACLAFLPWAVFVERHGGYAALLAHQRSYLDGPESWLPHWRIQMAQAVALSGPPIRGVLGWLLAIGLARGVGGDIRGVLRFPTLRDSTACVAGIAGALGSWLAADFGWWVSLLLVPRALVDPRRTVRFLAVAWLIPAILTPFYHPYARLWLPLHAAGWLLIGGAIGDLFRATGETSGRLRLRALAGNPGVLLTAGCLAAVVHWPLTGPWPVVLSPPSTAGRGLASLPRLVHDRLGGVRLGVRVLARPPALFYLGTAGLATQRLGGIDDLAVASAQPGLVLVDEAVLHRDSTLAFLRDYGALAETILAEPLRPVTMLDVDPASAFVARPRPAYRVFVLDSRRVTARP